MGHFIMACRCGYRSLAGGRLLAWTADGRSERMAGMDGHRVHDSLVRPQPSLAAGSQRQGTFGSTGFLRYGFHGHDLVNGLLENPQLALAHFQPFRGRSAQRECDCIFESCNSTNSEVNDSEKVLAARSILFFGACSAFTHVTACTLAESLNDPLHRKLRQLCCLRRRFDCYRVERTSSRAGVAPAEVQRLSRRTISTVGANR